MALHRLTSILIVVMTILILASEIHQSSAKPGGCSAFGHSCFGGHGKRADGHVALLPGPDTDQQPELEFRPEQEDADDVMIQGALPPSWTATAGIPPRVPPPQPDQYYLAPFLRQWFQSYRRSTGDVEVK